jgi:aminopeptidase N
VDPDAIQTVRVELRRHLASSLRNELLDHYSAQRIIGPYSPDAGSAARRALRNLCLGYLMELDDAQMRSLAMDQFDRADNMTDAMAALSTLANCDCPERGDALDRFYSQWKAEPLVVDKWLGVRKRPRACRTRLRSDPADVAWAFNIRNPSKVYALIGGFRGNQVRSRRRRPAPILADQVIYARRSTYGGCAGAQLIVGEFDGRQAHARAALERIETYRACHRHVRGRQALAGAACSAMESVRRTLLGRAQRRPTDAVAPPSGLWHQERAQPACPDRAPAGSSARATPVRRGRNLVARPGGKQGPIDSP